MNTTDQCHYMLRQYSTSTRGPNAPHRCHRPAVDGMWCARHVDSDHARYVRLLAEAIDRADRP